MLCLGLFAFLSHIVTTVLHNNRPLIHKNHLYGSVKLHLAKYACHVFIKKNYWNVACQ